MTKTEPAARQDLITEHYKSEAIRMSQLRSWLLREERYYAGLHDQRAALGEVNEMADFKLATLREALEFAGHESALDEVRRGARR